MTSQTHSNLTPTSRSNTHANTAAKPCFSTKNLQRISLVKLASGGIIAVSIISYYVFLEATCANTDPNDGAGELVITSIGGSANGAWVGTRFPAPLFVDASAKLSPNGTEEGELLWLGDLCDGVLDCKSCPLVIDPRYNVSILLGKILLCDLTANQAIYMCGMNRLGRTLGQTEMIGLGTAEAVQHKFNTAGCARKTHRLGEHRHSKPRDSDAGIPFPQFSLNEYAFAEFMNKIVIGEKATVRAVVSPTAPNPWIATFCGYWKPLSTILMLAHVAVAEQATCNLIGHARTSGLRLDLAQLALGTETVAHLIMALLQHDPIFSFHWAVLPVGAYSAFILGPIVLTCSSTLLLAAFWCVRRAPFLACNE